MSKLGPANIAERDTLTIRECQSCNALHQSVNVEVFKCPMPPFTHWYLCPTTGDPVYLTLVAYGDQPVGIAGDLVEMLAQAMASGRYLLLVSRIQDGEVITRRKTVNFPTGDFNTVLTHLQKTIDEEISPPEADEMETPELAPHVNIFGDN